MRSHAIIAGLAATASGALITAAPRAPVPTSDASLDSMDSMDGDDSMTAYDDSDDMPSSSCISAAKELYRDIPYPDKTLLSFLGSFAMTATATDDSIYCSMQTAMPSSVRGEWKSYTDEASSWYNAHSAAFTSIMKDCAHSDIADVAQSMPPPMMCPTADSSSSVAMASSSGPAGSSATPTSTSTSTSGSDSSSDSSSESASASSSVPTTGAATRNTGVLAGAVAAAGALGFVALL